MTYYQRDLPHWHPEGKVLFLTWRLDGSLPVGFRPLPDEKNAGKAFLHMDRELDKGLSGPVWLRNPCIAKCVVDALVYGERELGLYDLLAFVVMSNHVHVLLRPRVTVSKITRAIKGFTARQANKILGRSGKAFWKDESYDHWVRDNDELRRIVAYIERNPVTAGLVRSVEEWPWSSAAHRPTD